MAVEGVDYSWARPSPAGLRAAGKVFAGRYVGPGSQGKRLTLAEAKALTAAGVSVVALCEQAAGSAMGGHAKGAEHARLASLEAAACGMPKGHPIYFAVDWDASPAELTTVRAYFEGVASVLPHKEIGVYGGIRTVDWLLDRSLVAWGFQTYAWSGGAWDNRAAIQQYKNNVTVAGGAVDLCRGMFAYFGQWTVGGPVPPGQGDNVTTPEELWAADLIPVSGNPADPTLPAKAAVGETLDLVRAVRVQLAGVAEAMADPPPASVVLTGEDREAIIHAVTDAVSARIGMIPTAAEIARATADLLRDRLEE